MGCGFSNPQVDPQANTNVASQAVDPIGQGLQDAQDAVGLFDGIYKLVGPAVLDAVNKKNERDSLKRLIGPWWSQAFERGACRVPVLDIEMFESHLEKTNGVLKPRGSCTADSAWGYFLHALAINPEDKILAWKPAVGASWDMRGDALAMEVRGRAFCHLVNFYRVAAPTLRVVDVDGIPQERTYCHLSFGWLTWTSPDADHVFATFEADTMPKLNGPKQPMGAPGALLNDKLWESYKAACEKGKGISDPEMVWPDPKTTSLSKRLQCLVTNLDKVRYNNSGLIVTRQWLSNASNIKTRAMTNGGKDNSFLKDAYKALAEHPERSNIQEWEYGRAQMDLKQCFFFSEDRFTIQDADPPGIFCSPTPPLHITPREVLKLTLDSYEREDPESWKGQLYAARDSVITVACMSRVVRGRWPVCVRTLDFAEGDPLWEARVHL